MLITRYPGIRRLFIRHEKFKECKSQDDVLEIWGSDETNGQEWTLFLKFAALTMMGNEISNAVEKLPPSRLAIAVPGPALGPQPSQAEPK